MAIGVHASHLLIYLCLYNRQWYGINGRLNVYKLRIIHQRVGTFRSVNLQQLCIQIGFFFHSHFNNYCFIYRVLTLHVHLHTPFKTACAASFSSAISSSDLSSFCSGFAEEDSVLLPLGRRHLFLPM